MNRHGAIVRRLRWLIAPALLLAAAAPGAEPYLAAQQGQKCLACHANPSGGGLRNAAGHAFAQNQLAARTLDVGETQWLGQVNRFLSVGGDLRTRGTHSDLQAGEEVDPAFAVDELRVYFDFSVIPERLSLYVDQRLAPGSSRNLEAYGRLWLDGQHRYYLKAGQLYLPFGLRLEDDTAFIRQVPGINFDTPDNGVELGLESGPWSAQLAVSNGTAGGPEGDSGKQWSLRGEYVQSVWRAGASYNFNDAEAGERHLGALFVGLRTGPVVWLAEADYIEDRSQGSDPLRQLVGLLEANWSPRRGHNLKATLESLDPDTSLDDDEQYRYSLVWEYSPLQYLQFRAGVREYDGVAALEAQNRRFQFVELHVYF